MYNREAREVLQIRLSDSGQDYQIPWVLEKSSIFSIRSAYRLALDIDRDISAMAGSSGSPDGSRTIYQDIWLVNVPQKVRIFAWRQLNEGLATQLNRKHHKLEESGRCQICGSEDESGHHTVIRCTRAASLRKEMTKFWPLPPEHKFMQNGNEWLLMLLSSVNKDSKARILLLLWRAWLLRNDVTHGKGLATVKGFAEFLSSYASTLHISSDKRGKEASDKGKVVCEGETAMSQPDGEQ
jgi:hypothetical protein